jgi:lycopene cyclase domain-containing protein
VEYYTKWKALFPALFIIGAVYIIWDVIFTRNGVWGFNSRYLVDLEVLNLPIEEWLFFIVVPFACIFIYEATLYYFKKRPFQKFARPFSIFLGISLIIIGLIFYQKIYTNITFIAAGIFLLYHVFFVKRDYLDRFYIGFLFSLIPFILVNGVLTGSFIEDQIVWYNNDENLGIRLFTIPIEDSIYLLLYLLSITTIYEQILKRFPKRIA